VSPSRPAASGHPAFAPAYPGEPAADRSPHRVATFILLVYLLLVMSRVVEVLPVLLGINPHLTLILMVVCLLGALLTGGLVKAAKTPVVILFTALTFWFMLATLSSQWRGGSVRTLVFFWASSYACVLLLPSLVSTLDQCRKVCYVLAFSLVPIGLVTLSSQTQIQGRDSALFGTLGNPNDLAFSMLLLIPFAILLIQSESLLNWKTIVCVVAIIYALVKTLRTGSRAGVLTMLICFVILLLNAQMKTKVKMIVAAALIAIAAVPFVPSTVLLRYATVFSGTSYESAMSADEVSAVQSTRFRKMLFEESVRLMVEHPLFGVGPGVFSAALAGEQEKKGENQSWHEAHNSFTQMGSEAGFPATAIYIAILIYCLKRTISIYWSTKDDPKRIAICRMAGALTMALIVYTICAAFGNYGYSFQFPVIAGLVQAFDICVRRETAVAAPAPAPALVVSAPQLRPVAAPATPLGGSPAVNPRVPIHVRHRRIRNNRV
jgi:O-antigen ligase